MKTAVDGVRRNESTDRSAASPRNTREEPQVGEHGAACKQHDGLSLHQNRRSPGRSQESTATGVTKQRIRDLHVASRSPFRKDVFDGVAFLVLSACALAVWQTWLWPVVILFWLVGGHFGHTKPLMFHDAAHGTLHPDRVKNEIMGVAFGTLIFVPLTVYRHAHAMHHAHICSERDPEMWPFVLPGVPRWQRRLSAAVEICCGIFYTPLLMFRSLLIHGNVSKSSWIRIGLEYALAVAFWGTVLSVIHTLGWWEYFLVGYFAPAAVGAAYQTLNKYTEHLGLLGRCVLTSTRTVVDKRDLGKLFSYSMQHVDHHGTHHRYAKIPYYNLPSATPYVYKGEEVTVPVYPSYWSAFCDMLRTLPDPKAGGQWLGDDESPVQQNTRPGESAVPGGEK